MPCTFKVTCRIREYCENGEEPMKIENDYLPCPELGAPCPRASIFLRKIDIWKFQAGYTCQETSRRKLYCCPLDLDSQEYETPEPSTRARTKNRGRNRITKSGFIGKTYKGNLGNWLRIVASRCMRNSVGFVREKLLFLILFRMQLFQLLFQVVKYKLCELCRIFKINSKPSYASAPYWGNDDPAPGGTKMPIFI